MEGQWANLINFSIYLAISLPILAIGIFLFIRLTPFNEVELIGEGDEIDIPRKAAAAQAAAYTLGGKVLGLSLVLASAIFHSVNVIDLALWGSIGIVFQIILFYFYELITPFKVIEEIPNGNISVGILSSFLSVSIGLLLAALISY